MVCHNILRSLAVFSTLRRDRRLCTDWLGIMLTLLVRLTVFDAETWGLMVNHASALRVLLGLAEAGLYPGVVFYLSWLASQIRLGDGRFMLLV